MVSVWSYNSHAGGDNLRIGNWAEPEIDTFMEIGERNFRVKRVGRGKLGNSVVSGHNTDGDSMTIVQADNGEFAGNVRMDGKNFRVKPNGELERAGRVKKNDVIVRKL